MQRANKKKNRNVDRFCRSADQALPCGARVGIVVKNPPCRCVDFENQTRKNEPVCATYRCLPTTTQPVSGSFSLASLTLCKNRTHPRGMFLFVRWDKCRAQSQSKGDLLWLRVLSLFGSPLFSFTTPRRNKTTKKKQEHTFSNKKKQKQCSGDETRCSRTESDKKNKRPHTHTRTTTTHLEALKE